VKVVVISCVEPEHLRHCLQALALWVDPADVVVVDNANTRASSDHIQGLARAAGHDVLRPHDHVDGRGTIEFIHEALKTVCAAFPGETILKVDEDILFAADPASIDPGPAEFLVPAVTINNYTTKRYVAALRPELHERIRDHPQLWHEPHPVTGAEHRLELLDVVYGRHPAELAAVCAPAPREVVGRAEWADRALMGDATTKERRGISSTALAFRASHYLELAEEFPHGVEEAIIGEAVWRGRSRYAVDWSLYCHHVNYFTLRRLIQANAAAVAEYNDHVLDVLARRVVAVRAARAA
jgi:hypothetical protein